MGGELEEMGFDGGSGSAEIRAVVHLYGVEERKDRVEDDIVGTILFRRGVHGIQVDSEEPQMRDLDVVFLRLEQRVEPGAGRREPNCVVRIARRANVFQQ